MSYFLFRRRRLGRGSCLGIQRESEKVVNIVRNDSGVVIPEDANVIRWGCTSTIGPPHYNIFNTAGSIHQVNDKMEFRNVLQENEIGPETLFSYDAFWDDGIDDNSLWVRRPRYHAQGRNLRVVRYETLRAEYLANDPDMEGHYYYATRLVDKVAEYRVAVVQGRAAWVARKTPGNPQDVAWNVARGGRFDNVRWDEWPLRVVKIAIQAFNLTELDFGGVDVMVDRDGECYVLEINSAPSLTSPYRQRCFAKCFDYMVEDGDRISIVEERGGYRKFIHPALRDNAIV